MGGPSTECISCGVSAVTTSRKLTPRQSVRPLVEAYVGQKWPAPNKPRRPFSGLVLFYLTGAGFRAGMKGEASKQGGKMNIFGWFYLFERYPPQSKVRDIPGHAIIQAKRIGDERAAQKRRDRDEQIIEQHEGREPGCSGRGYYHE